MKGDDIADGLLNFAKRVLAQGSEIGALIAETNELAAILTASIKTAMSRSGKPSGLLERYQPAGQMKQGAVEISDALRRPPLGLRWAGRLASFALRFAAKASRTAPIAISSARPKISRTSRFTCSSIMSLSRGLR